MAPGVYCTLSQNLAAGKKLEEAEGFNFSKIRNGSKVRRKLSELTKQLKQMYEAGQAFALWHFETGGDDAAILHAFGVRYDDKTKIGEIVMHDLNHLSLWLHKLPTKEETRLKKNIWGLIENGNAVQQLEKPGRVGRFVRLKRVKK